MGSVHQLTPASSLTPSNFSLVLEKSSRTLEKINKIPCLL